MPDRVPKDVELDTCYRQRAGFKTEEVVGEMLVLDDERGQVHQLNPTASYIWAQCDGSASVVEIAYRLTQRFDVDERVAEKDVSKVIHQLLERRLITE